ncbi:MAG: uracil-DNA glycosylase [Hyphomicrobiales bacterium]|nr:uracil-DNA glycosylase [Hyphomicrobiales bacterium]
MAAMDDLTREGLAAALAFQSNAGVDLALDDAPHDRFAEFARPEPARPQPRAAFPAPTNGEPPTHVAPAPVSKAPARAPNAALAADIAAVAASAQAQAAQARDFEDLRARLEAFDGCALKNTATQLVFEDGARGAQVMFVGEAPGAEEDREGRPFVGRAGQLLDRMLASIGLDRSLVYIANIVPWRPPGNRTPTPQEAVACLPFIKRQIELCAPEILICLGAPSMQALLPVKDGILKSRGKWLQVPIGAREVPAMAMLHPAYLLRQPLQKRLAWRDLRALKRVLDGERPRMHDAP